MVLPSFFMKFKAVFFDLDGTIVHPSFELAKEALGLCLALKEKGMKLGVATGRSFLSAKPYLKALQVIDAGVFSNGAVIENPFTQKIELIQAIPGKEASLLTEILRKEEYSFRFQTLEGTLYHYGTTHWPEYEYAQDPAFHEGLVGQEAIKVIILCDEKGIKTSARLLASFEKYPDLMGKVRFFKSAGYALEACHWSISKWTGIEIFLKAWNIEAKEVITVGDQENDLDMIKNAGYGISVLGGYDGNHNFSKFKITPPEKGGVRILAHKLLSDL